MSNHLLFDVSMLVKMMLRSLKFSVHLLLFVAICTGCNTPTANQPNMPSPTTTSTITIKVKPTAVSRVVALSSLSADIVYRLAPSKLVGIPGSRVLRRNAELATIKKVSEGQTPPNLEVILSLKPDFVLGAAGFHDQILEKLEKSGIKTLKTEVTSWQALQQLTRTIAEAIQVDPTPLLQSYDMFVANRPTYEGSTLVLVSYQPILAPNKTSWAGDLLAQFQINNLAANLQGQSPQRGYVTLSPEKVIEANPETLILVDAGDGAIEKMKSSQFWSQLKAVERDRVFVFDYYGLVNPGSINAIQDACFKLQKLRSTSS
jgi:iron complex transport system substrate-binding protein